MIRDLQMRDAKRALESKLREALESGPATPMTPNEWEEIEREVWERDRQERSQP